MSNFIEFFAKWLKFKQTSPIDEFHTKAILVI